MCQPEDTVGYLKKHISLALKNEWKPDQMRLIIPKENKVLDNDDDKLKQYEDLGIKNEAELYVVFQISENVWETVTVQVDESTAPPPAAAAAAQES